jgi:hypothetical protein
MTRTHNNGGTTMLRQRGARTVAVTTEQTGGTYPPE